MPVLDDRLAYLLAYPAFDREVAEQRFEMLTKAGVSEILDEGNVLLGRYRVLGKGHASIVLKGIWKGKEVAIKVLRIDSKRDSLRREAGLLKLVNSIGVGPRLILDLDFALIMEFVHGIRFGEWVPKDEHEARKIIEELLDQCRKLDKIGIDHGELSNPARHVIVGPKLVIIDFESASTERRPANVTSVAQYLFIGGKRSEFFRSLLHVDVRRLISLLREYKERMDDESFRELIEGCKLSSWKSC